MWSDGAADDDTPGPDDRPPEDILYSIEQAAAVVGRSTKAIHRRIDRRTLRGRLVDGRRYVSRTDLVRAGLLGNELKATIIERGIARLVQHLVLRPGEPLAQHELVRQALLPRQSCEVALSIYMAADLVNKGYDESWEGCSVDMDWPILCDATSSPPASRASPT